MIKRIVNEREKLFHIVGTVEATDILALTHSQSHGEPRSSSCYSPCPQDEIHLRFLATMNATQPPPTPNLVLTSCDRRHLATLVACPRRFSDARFVAQSVSRRLRPSPHPSELGVSFASFLQVLPPLCSRLTARLNNVRIVFLWFSYQIMGTNVVLRHVFCCVHACCRPRSPGKGQ